MGSLSNTMENAVLDHCLKNSALATFPGIFVALSKADPTDDASGLDEPSSGNYARKEHNSWDAAANRLTENTGVITFNQATANWGTITHYALYSAASGGTFIAHGSLSASKKILTDNTPSIADGQIEVSFNTGGISDYLANKMLDHIFKTGDFSQVAHIFHALCSSAVTSNMSGGDITEPSGGAYARWENDDWDAAVSGVADNTNDEESSEATASWGTIVAAALLDTSTLATGHVLFFGSIATQEVGNGDKIKFPAGDFDVTCS